MRFGLQVNTRGETNLSSINRIERSPFFMEGGYVPGIYQTMEEKYVYFFLYR